MQLLLEGGHFYEGARWRDGHFWVSDLYAHQVLKIAPDGHSEVVAELDDQPSGLGWLPGGDLLVVGMTKCQLWRCPAGGKPSLHADLKALTRGFTNDMVVHPSGHAYVGTFGFELFEGEPPAPGTLLRVDPQGRIAVAAEGLLFPNGMVITADGKTLIVAETFGGRLSAFDIAADGSLSNQRCWAQLGRMPPWDSVHSLLDTDFAPDGCAIDPQGRVWVADALGNRAVRVAEGGRILEEVRAPDGLGLYSCALGGMNGDTLLVCTAPDFSDVNRKAAAEARLYTCTVSGTPT